MSAGTKLDRMLKRDFESVLLQTWVCITKELSSALFCRSRTRHLTTSSILLVWGCIGSTQLSSKSMRSVETKHRLTQNPNHTRPKSSPKFEGLCSTRGDPLGPNPGGGSLLQWALSRRANHAKAAGPRMDWVGRSYVKLVWVQYIGATRWIWWDRAGD